MNISRELNHAAVIVYVNRITSDGTIPWHCLSVCLRESVDKPINNYRPIIGAVIHNLGSYVEDYAFQ